MADANSIPPGILTRKQAKSEGLTRYFTGKPCVHGHIAERFTCFGQCVECTVKHRDAWYWNNRDRARAKNKDWHANNRPAKRKINAKYRANHPETVRAAIKAHHQANPELYATYRAARRARQRAAPGDGFSAEDVKRISEAQRWRCAACGQKARLTVDHIVPLAKGGPNDPSNLQMFCKPCNSSKGAKEPHEFAATLGRLL